MAREMVESPCLEEFRKHMDVAFGIWVSGEQDSAGGMAELDDFKVMIPRVHESNFALLQPVPREP